MYCNNEKDCGVVVEEMSYNAADTLLLCTDSIYDWSANSRYHKNTIRAKRRNQAQNVG